MQIYLLVFECEFKSNPFLLSIELKGHGERIAIGYPVDDPGNACVGYKIAARLVLAMVSEKMEYGDYRSPERRA